MWRDVTSLPEPCKQWKDIRKLITRLGIIITIELLLSGHLIVIFFSLEFWMCNLMLFFQGVDVNRYECHVCGQRYTRGSGLTNHLKKKHSFSWPAGHPRFRLVHWTLFKKSFKFQTTSIAWKYCSVAFDVHTIWLWSINWQLKPSCSV